MSDEPRVHSTSLRYSEEVFKIVESASGKTFADRFENICLDYRENKQKRQKQIKDLDKQIADKEKQLNELRKKVYKLSDITDMAGRINKLMIELSEKCNT